MQKMNIKNTIMIDPELLQYMNETAEELRELKELVSMLRQELRERKAKSRYLTMGEACEYIHKSRSTMQRWIAEGKIDFAVKNGGTYLFPEERLRAYASGMA